MNSHLICAGTMLVLVTFSVPSALASDTDPIARCRRKLTFDMVRKAGQGEPETDYCVAIAFDRGDMGFKQDKSRAVQLLRSSAGAGYAPAQLVLGEHYAKGDGVQQDFREAMDLWRQSAAQGFAGAQNDLGVAYLNGWGVPKDLNEAARWFGLAAAQGDAKAQNNLNALRNSITRSPRTEPAQDLYEQAVRAYKSGQKEAAAKRMLAAAQSGNSLAQQSIAWDYLNGAGVPKNAAEAAKWYRASANSGNSSAMWNLGLLYERGEGVSEDWVEAANWYRKSAELNDPIGQRELGFAYQYGIGVPQSRKSALEWHRRAAASRDSQSTRWVSWLSDPTNSIGFRNSDEQALYERSGLTLVYGNLMAGDPAGLAFRNEAERFAWLEKAGKKIEQGAAENATRVARSEYERKQSEYRQCMNAGGSGCSAPTPPRPPR